MGVLKKMELPERKSHTLVRAMLSFNENLTELMTKHKSISDEILDLTSSLLESDQEKIEIAQALEDLEYDMENNILLNLEMVFETLEGFEINLIEIDSYLPIIKDEQELLKDLKLSAKNLVKTISMTDDTLHKQEQNNLTYLHESYKKLRDKTQNNLNEISEILTKQIQKVKKMENI